MPLTKENYQHLFNKVDNNMIIKTRYMVPLEDGHVVEMDFFFFCLEGLVFAEVEFSSVEDSENFDKPSWLGEDISFDSRYDNTLLSKLDKYNEEDFE